MRIDSNIISSTTTTIKRRKLEESIGKHSKRLTEIFFELNRKQNVLEKNEHQNPIKINRFLGTKFIHVYCFSDEVTQTHVCMHNQFDDVVAFKNCNIF